ncbi:MAG: putative Ig domain-containing protein [Candidatus Thiodiazotropha sp.]
MKALRTLLSLILLPALYLTEINQLQAGTDYLTFDRAAWRASKDLLVFKGTGTPYTTVELFVAGTDISLGTKRINKRGRWRFKFYGPASIPCSARAENGTVALIKDVNRAPADCFSGSEPPAENTAPVISGSPRNQVAEGEAYSFTPGANDADGDSLTFSIVNKPAWANFSESTGRLSGTPGYNAAGTSDNIRISVSDGSDSASLDAFSITVDNTNRPPTISGIPTTSVTEGVSYSFTPQASDADGDSLSFSIQNRPDWADFNASSGTLSGTPGYSDAGTTSNIHISVSDGNVTATLAAFSITVGEANRAPTISGIPATSVAEGASYSFVPQASDADGENLSFTIVNRPAWASFDTSTGALSGEPGYSDAGTTSGIRISVSDGHAVASLNTFNITVAETNRAPTISGSPADSVDEESAYSFTPSATDPDGDALTFSISNMPGWAVFDPSSGNLSGTPDSNSAGSYSNIVISVSDGSEVASLGGFTITVADNATQGGTFQFAEAEYSVDEGNSVTLTITRDNGNGEATVNYGTYGREARNTLDYNGYVWTPLVFADGETSKTITLDTLTDEIAEPDETLGMHLDAPSDGYSLGSPSISVVTIHDVSDPNSEPVISGTADEDVIVGSEYHFAPSASDADNDMLSFSITNLPTWASFNSESGVLSGTPGAEDVGIYNDIVIAVSDGTASASLDPLSITVTEAEAGNGSISLNWIPPSTRTDGSSLDMSEIAGYKIYMGSSSEDMEQIVDLADCTINEYSIDNLTVGDYYFAVTTYDTEGNESGFSNIAMKSAM